MTPQADTSHAVPVVPAESGGSASAQAFRAQPSRCARRLPAAPEPMPHEHLHTGHCQSLSTHRMMSHGPHRVFSAPVVSVYGVLASGHGFKIGFQFGPRSSVTLKTIADILR